ncbi:MAG: protein-(glutamine-N5) methyltransferase, release factor-specific [Rickettsiales bacterium]|nr:protein-(glutamine-N5) methyltransferase, release factor-specific [Rickettsiales bacterium]
MYLNALIKTYVEKFILAGYKTPINEIRAMISDTIDISLINQITNSEIIINEKEEKKLKKALNRRIKKEPKERILNKKIFRDVDLILNKNTFIPRSETELLIDIVIEKKISPKYLLELGTGSGAISISLMKNFPQSRTVATDINQKSLKLAKKNAKKNKVIDQINFICCNWLDIFVNIEFDLIVANPPYIRTGVINSLDPEVKKYDPHLALDGGLDGLNAYKEILHALKPLLKPNTVIIFEIGFDQAKKVSKLMKEVNIMNIKVFKDYSNKDRFIMGSKKI